jgi:hypothetical protein
MKTFKLETESKIKSGFTTPDHYFEDFSAKIMQKLPIDQTKIISVFARKNTWIYAAAAVLLLALTLPIYLNRKAHSSEIDNETLEHYITYHSNLSDTELVNLLDEEDIEKISIEVRIEDSTIENELSENKNIEQNIVN